MGRDQNAIHDNDGRVPRHDFIYETMRTDVEDTAHVPTACRQRRRRPNARFQSHTGAAKKNIFNHTACVSAMASRIKYCKTLCRRTLKVVQISYAEKHV